MRVLIAGILGGLAMFMWTSFAHMATPLGATGISQMANEGPALSALESATANKPGLYLYPYVNMNSKTVMQDSEEAMKIHPSGLILFHPAGAPAMAPTMFIGEFVKELVQALIAAYLCAMVATAGFMSRTLFVTLIGVSAGIATNASYFLWYRFPLDYTLAQLAIEVVGAFFAGLAIAWWLGRTKTA
jgi:hypothetical protein